MYVRRYVGCVSVYMHSLNLTLRTINYTLSSSIKGIVHAKKKKKKKKKEAVYAMQVSGVPCCFGPY